MLSSAASLTMKFVVPIEIRTFAMRLPKTVRPSSFASNTVLRKETNSPLLYDPNRQNHPSSGSAMMSLRALSSEIPLCFNTSVRTVIAGEVSSRKKASQKCLVPIFA